MQIVEPDKKQLNDFVLENNGSFLQSWQWGELQERMGRKINRLLIIDNHNRAVVAALFVKHDLLLGKYYLLCPKGPVISKNSPPHEEGLGEVIETMLTMTPLTSPLMRGEKEGGLAPHEGEKPIFIRIEPEVLRDSRFIIHNSWFRKAPKDHNPRATILVDLKETEKQILEEMHHKTRYNIKLAERKNVKCQSSNVKTDEFINLLGRTAKRDKFHLHPRKYYEELSKMEEIKSFGAYGGKGGVIAAALVSFWGNKAVYLHGASDYDSRSLMAPYLLHWEIIRAAKARGLKYYDLGGVSPKDEPIPGWEGLTRFKTGFGGEYVEYVGSWDFVTSPVWYMVYKLARRVL